MQGIVSVRFGESGRTYRYDPGDLDLQVGNKVIVESAQGHQMATVTSAKRPRVEAEAQELFRPVLRKATREDLEQYIRNDEEEREAFSVCRDLIDEHGLDMMLVAAEYTYDDRKLLFYFTADGRVDFRDLVRDLAARFHVRIELRQIGVRDDAKMNGGMGICGRPLCCSSWMDNFAPVSIRMAKEQNISMNPTKVSGNCGRLLCCLNYENEAYKVNRKLLPKLGSLVDTPEGKAKVIQQDVLGLKLTLLPKIDEKSWGQAYTVEAEQIGYGTLRAKPSPANLAQVSANNSPRNKERSAFETQESLSLETKGTACQCSCSKKHKPDLQENELVASAEGAEVRESVTDAKPRKPRYVIPQNEAE